MEYTIPLYKLEEEFSLERVFVPENYQDINIVTPEVGRPGLALAGFYEIFEKDRLCLIGNAEYRYLSGLDKVDRAKKIADFIDAHRKFLLKIIASVQLLLAFRGR